MKAAHHEITQALLDAYNGDEAAASRLWAMVYEELQKIAHRELLDERANHTLNTTGLVHEAYVKLVDHTRITWQNRAHFYALACRAMRRILVDYARRRSAQKRGGHDSPLPLEEAMALAEGRSEELVALDEALERLSEKHPRLAQVVECRYFGGLTTEETAETMGVSISTVNRLWKRAKTYLLRALRQDETS